MRVFLLRFWIAGEQGGLCYASLKGEDCCQLVSLFMNAGEGVYVGSETRRTRKTTGPGVHVDYVVDL
jgi:hypothetical protein